MAQQMIKRAIERLLKEVNEPLTTTEILGLSDRRYKNVPSVNSIGQILSRDKRFVKVTFDKKVKQIAWTTKEETQ
jgi:hypothetical protein